MCHAAWAGAGDEGKISQGPTKRMKKLNWSKIGQNSLNDADNSLWKRVSLSDSVKGGKVNYKDLETLFSQKDIDTRSSSASGNAGQNASKLESPVVSVQSISCVFWCDLKCLNHCTKCLSCWTFVVCASMC